MGPGSMGARHLSSWVARSNLRASAKAPMLAARSGPCRASAFSIPRPMPIQELWTSPNARRRSAFTAPRFFLSSTLRRLTTCSAWWPCAEPADGRQPGPGPPVGPALPRDCAAGCDGLGMRHQHAVAGQAAASELFRPTAHVAALTANRTLEPKLHVLRGLVELTAEVDAPLPATIEPVQLRDERRLADARVARHQHQLRPALRLPPARIPPAAPSTSALAPVEALRSLEP